MSSVPYAYCIVVQVGRAGRFGTKGLAITFVASASDSDVLNQVQYHQLSRCTYFFFEEIILCKFVLMSDSKCSFCFQVQERFEVDIKELPEQIDTTTYSKFM